MQIVADGCKIGAERLGRVHMFVGHLGPHFSLSGHPSVFADGK